MGLAFRQAQRRRPAIQFNKRVRLVPSKMKYPTFPSYVRGTVLLRSLLLITVHGTFTRLQLESESWGNTWHSRTSQTSRMNCDYWTDKAVSLGDGANTDEHVNVKGARSLAVLKRIARRAKRRALRRGC